jgi:oxygen-dependent protoporphyrinogen oxidase
MEVAIVGGGITGLALTHHLAKRDIDSTTFEKADEPGGAVRSRTVEGHTIEVGPQRMRRTPGIDELIDVAGLEDAAIEADDRALFVYSRGKLRQAPMEVPIFLRTSLLSWRGKCRMLSEPLTRQGLPEETAAELFTRKFGREAYERFIGPLYGGIYGSDPAEMPAAYALEGLLEREQAAGSLLQAFRNQVGGGTSSAPLSFDAGKQQRPRGIYDQYSSRIQLDTPVTDIRRSDSPTEPAKRSQAAREGIRRADGGSEPATSPQAPLEDSPGYVVETADGTHQVDHIVVTTPAFVTADLLSGVADGADGLSELTYNPLALVHLEADADREGFGYQVALDESLHTLGASWNASMFDRENLYTVFLGGMHEPEMVDRPTEEIGQIAAEEFEQVMGAEARVLNVETRDRWFPAYDRSWAHLDTFETPPGIHMATNYTARMGIPSRVREAKQLAEQLSANHA